MLTGIIMKSFRVQRGLACLLIILKITKTRIKNEYFDDLKHKWCKSHFTNLRRTAKEDFCLLDLRVKLFIW